MSTEIVQRVTRALACSACGTAGEANCDCGAPYLPASVRAAKAVAKDPGKSNRAIAAEIGVDHKTVGAARKAGGEHSPPERVTGKDGKSYPQPEKKPKLNALGKPYSPQYDPNYKMRKVAPPKAPDRGCGDVVEDMLGILSGLNNGRRADFFKALWDKFRDELLVAQTIHDALYADGSYGGDNAPPPEVGAANMKAQFAALDDGPPAA